MVALKIALIALGRFGYYIFVIAIVIYAVNKALKNYSKGSVDYNENFEYDKETGFKRLDVAMLEQIKGGIETTDYVQNNNLMIEKYLNPVNSTFTANAFVSWAKGVIIETCDKGCSPFVNNSIMLSDKFKSINMAYLNLYRKKGNQDILKMFFTISKAEDENNRFFAVFQRKSCFVSVTHGEVEGVSCPFCGGKLEFKNNNVTKCEYCDNIVSFRENDWVLCKIEPVNNNVENIGIIVEE